MEPYYSVVRSAEAGHAIDVDVVEPGVGGPGGEHRLPLEPPYLGGSYGWFGGAGSVSLAKAMLVHAAGGDDEVEPYGPEFAATVLDYIPGAIEPPPEAAAVERADGVRWVETWRLPVTTVKLWLQTRYESGPIAVEAELPDPAPPCRWVLDDVVV